MPKPVQEEERPDPDLEFLQHVAHQTGLIKAIFGCILLAAVATLAWIFFRG
jgi:hypothetical protein